MASDEKLRNKLLGEIDDEIAAAVLRGRAELWGGSPAEQQMYRMKWRQARHPLVADRLVRVGKSVGALERAGKVLINFVQQHAKPGKEAESAAKGTAKALEAVHHDRA